MGTPPNAGESVLVEVVEGSAFLDGIITDNTTNDPSLQIAQRTEDEAIHGRLTRRGRRVPRWPAPAARHPESSEGSRSIHLESCHEILRRPPLCFGGSG